METATIKVLAIDDSPDNLLTLEAVLGDALPECRLTTASNGPSGIALARAEDPDVILLDIIMPGMDGYSVCRQLKEDHRLRAIPVVFLTALRDDRDSRVKAVEVGAEAFLSKPFDDVELVVRVRAMAKIKAANRLVRQEKEELARLVGERTDELSRELANRKWAQEALEKSERRFRGLIERSLVGVYILQRGVFLYCNRRLEQMFGYGAGELLGVHIADVIVAEDLPELLVQVENRDSSRPPLQARGRRRDGGLIDLELAANFSEVDVDAATVGMVQDITERRRAREQIERHVAELEEAFMSTVMMATTLGEMRDPYTAGHERRVAAMAVAIGAELGFDKDRLKGLRVGALLHDIGKINIPAEILAKPGKLSEIEWKIIRQHCQSGCDVLSNIACAWPLAQMAFQHHERLDGSGYPQGLHGEEILFEARVIAVADVVEAMSSHRPYRPGRGIAAALEEIASGRGTLYDSAAVDACLKLFSEENYVIPD